MLHFHNITNTLVIWNYVSLHHVSLMFHFCQFNTNLCTYSKISIKPRSCNLKIPTIQHLKRVVPDWMSFINETGRSQKHVQKGLQQCLHITCCGAAWPLISNSTNLSAMKTAENTEEEPDEPESADRETEQLCSPGQNSNITTCKNQVNTGTIW